MKNLVALAPLLVGCYTVSIVKPQASSNAANPVQAEVSINSNADQNSFRATLDGQDVTGKFTPTGTTRTADLGVLTAGAHTLEVFARLGRAFYTDTNRSSFQVAGSSTPPTNPPTPALEVEVSPAPLSVPWGQTATLTVTLLGKNNLDDTFTLSVDGRNDLAPVLPGPIAITPSAPQKSATLRLAPKEAQAAVTQGTRIRVTARSATRTVSSAWVTLNVLRTPGDFREVTLSSAAPSCGPVTSSLSGGKIRFKVGSRETSWLPFIKTAIDRTCRAAFVQLPVTNQLHQIDYLDVGFGPPAAKDPIPARVGQVDGVVASLFSSPDGSLFAVVQPGAAPATMQVVVVDLVQGATLGPHQMAAATNVKPKCSVAGDQVTCTVLTPANSTDTATWPIR